MEELMRNMAGAGSYWKRKKGERKWSKPLGAGKELTANPIQLCYSVQYFGMIFCTTIKPRSQYLLVRGNLLYIKTMVNTGIAWSLSLQVCFTSWITPTLHILHVLFFRPYLGDSRQLSAEFTQFCVLDGLHKHLKFWFQISSRCIEKHRRKFNWMSST